MTGKPKVPNETEVVDAYNLGRLIHDVFDRFDFVDESDYNSILYMCVGLHNAGKIDLLSLTKRPEFANITGHRFFSGQDFFCKAIPKLNAVTYEMMRCVDALVEKGGADLAAGQPNAAFLEWCKADVSMRVYRISRSYRSSERAVRCIPKGRNIWQHSYPAACCVAFGSK